MSKRDKLLGVLESSRFKMLEQLKKIEVNREVYALWTVREILAHLSGWDNVVISFIQAIRIGQVPSTLGSQSIDQYNAVSLADRKDQNYDQIFREFVEIRAGLIELIKQIPEEEIDVQYILPWGSNGTLEDILSIWGSHEEEHAYDVKKIIAQNL